MMFASRYIFKSCIYRVNLCDIYDCFPNNWRQLAKFSARLCYSKFRRYSQLVSMNYIKKTIAENGIFKFSDYDCIGFDLDNTLARYKVGAMIEMEYNVIANYLIEKKGHSKKHLLKPFDKNFILKGLIVDDENGNILRISPNGIILQATHGTTFLKKDEILEYYPNQRWEPTDLFAKDPLLTWNGPYSDRMRTLLDYFDIAASLIFARLVDCIDNDEKGKQKTYTIWPDILEALQDMFKREHFLQDKGGYFPEMKGNPEKYYYKCSEDLIKWLCEFRRRGKLLFLLTGAHVDFASHTAANTLGPKWRNLFDIVVCFAKKPGFFTMKRDFIALDGFEEKGPVKLCDLTLGGMYTHGNWSDMHKFLSSQSKVEEPSFLYVGDNLIQDIYTPHVYSHCDTVTVCEELEAEGMHGHNQWHPDEQFLVSTNWGSYFKCKDTNEITNWYHMMRAHSRLCVPSVEFLSSYSIDHEFKANAYYEK